MQVNLGISPGYIVNLATGTDTVSNVDECGGVIRDREPRTLDAEPIEPLPPRIERRG